MSSTLFRFAVGTSHPQSEVWSVAARNSDVYLASSDHRHALKVSLHASGVCQYAMLPQFFDCNSQNWSPRQRDRALFRWKRQTTPDYGGLHTFSIAFAAFEGIWTEVGDQEKAVSLLPAPTWSNASREVDVFYSWSDPGRNLDAIDPNITLIDCVRLKSGEYVSFFHRVGLLPLDIFEFHAISGRGALTLGVDFETEGGDARGVSVHEIVQERVGSATLYSLHNMRMKKIPEEEASDYPHLLKHWTGQPITFDIDD